MAAGRADSDFAGRRISFGSQVIQWLHLIWFDETILASFNTISVVRRKWTRTGDIGCRIRGMIRRDIWMLHLFSRSIYYRVTHISICSLYE